MCERRIGFALCTKVESERIINLHVKDSVPFDNPPAEKNMPNKNACAVHVASFPAAPGNPPSLGAIQLPRKCTKKLEPRSATLMLRTKNVVVANVSLLLALPAFILHRL